MALVHSHWHDTPLRKQSAGHMGVLEIRTDEIKSSCRPREWVCGWEGWGWCCYKGDSDSDIPYPIDSLALQPAVSQSYAPSYRIVFGGEGLRFKSVCGEGAGWVSEMGWFHQVFQHLLWALASWALKGLFWGFMYMQYRPIHFEYKYISPPPHQVL